MLNYSNILFSIADGMKFEKNISCENIITNMCLFICSKSQKINGI